MTARHIVLVVLVLIAAGGLPPSGANAADVQGGPGIFITKHCDPCHGTSEEPGAAPTLEMLRQPQGEMELAGRLWNHVPAMFETLRREGVRWPHITPAEMADLMAFLGADRTRDAAPDIARGEQMLMRKGCLKCHSLRREGGRVNPDLAVPRADYVSAAAWAAAMWTHTPRMAALAARSGIAYPRFSGAEMVHLVGFLRSTAESAARDGKRR